MKTCPDGFGVVVAVEDSRSHSGVEGLGSIVVGVWCKGQALSKAIVSQQFHM